MTYGIMSALGVAWLPYGDRYDTDIPGLGGGRYELCSICNTWDEIGWHMASCQHEAGMVDMW